MTSILLSGPVGEPLSLAEAKSWLRVDGSDEDALIQSLISSARQAVEAATNRLLITQQWRVTLDAWPDGGILLLPLTPVSAVSRIRTLDANGVATDVSPTLYSLDGNADRARILLAGQLPPPAKAFSGIWIDLAVGYGDATFVPEPIRLAMRRLIAFWFANRGDDGARGADLPTSVAAMLAPFRIRRLA